MNIEETRALHDETNEIEQSMADRIIQVVQDAPAHTIRPARVAAELGISVNDACAELCALMAAVGEKASFRFTNQGTDVMEFQFPSDFARRARQKQRMNDMKTSLKIAAGIALRALKVITAFGLIVSLLILCVVAIVFMLALLVAASRAGQDHGGHRSILTRQIRSLFYTIRQLLWLYAVFGPSPEGQDPVLREMAYDLSLVLSCCCGNPASFFYWLRARQLANRQSQAMRRWRDSTAVASDIPGIFLVEGRNERESSETAVGDGPKGILSIAVEFLFGPDPPQPEDPSSIWRLRLAAILSCSSKKKDGGVGLVELTPYVDDPPRITHKKTAKLVEQTLLIVAHFNGIPKENSDLKEGGLLDAEFFFPELIAESDIGEYRHSVMEDDETFAAFLFRKDGSSRTPLTDLPEYWHEERYKFTTLTATQLIHCATLGTLNFLGVWWLGQWTSEYGVLYMGKDSAMIYVLSFIFPVLQNYAILFLTIPVCRMIILLLLNWMRKERNKRRQLLAMALSVS